MISLRLLAGGVLVWLVVAAAGAHTIRPAVVTATFARDATVTIAIRTNAEALLARVGPEHTDTDDSPNVRQYDSLRQLSPPDLAAAFAEFAPEYLNGIEAYFDSPPTALELDRVEVPEVGDVDLARDSVIYLTGLIPANAKSFSWRYPIEYGSNVLRLGYPDDEVVRSDWLRPGADIVRFDLDTAFIPRSRREVARDYTVLGFTHIVPLGLDHILFVLGIFLLSVHLRPVLWQVTAFTVAHTITLGMSIYGLISLPASIVEPLIAASIVYVGVENVLSGQLKPFRVVIVFLFGLLHGLGFAGVLTEIGLPRSEFLTALVTFNIGVEFGQLAVIAMAFAIVGGFRNRPWYRQRIVIPLSTIIALVGAFWMVERMT